MDVQNNFVSKINPLEIYKILQQTLIFLNPCDLGQCRLVNSTWNYAALCLLRQKQCLHLQSVKTFVKFNTAFLPSLSEDVDNNSPEISLPYKSCIFSSELMDPESPDFMAFHPGALTFSTKFGQYFTEIHLSLSNSDNPVGRRLLENILFKWFPNLETLSLLLRENPFDYFSDLQLECQGTSFRKMHKLKKFHFRWSGYGNIENIPSFDMTSKFFNPILSMAVNLETISCEIPSFLKHEERDEGVLSENYALSNDQLFQGFQSFLIEDKGTKGSGPLQIYVPLHASNPQLEGLINCLNPNLQSIYLALDKYVLEHTILEFFQRFKILKTVCVEFPKNIESSMPKITIPCVSMINLKRMTIVNYVGYFHFLNYFPNLKNLKIFGILSSASFSILTNKHIKNTSLTSLTISFNTSSNMPIISRPNIGPDLFSTFPNLRALTLQNTDNATLKSIFGALTQLTSLHISGKGISDEGICGESDKILRLLLESYCVDDNNKTMMEKVCWDFTPRYPSITCLKYLQSCSIKADLITDACLIFGICKCLQLKRLEIKSNLELITKFGFTSLVQLQNLESLKIYVRNFGWASLKKLRDEI